MKPILVDFVGGKLAHRRLYGGGKNQLLAKAIGIKSKITLSVIDVTAGLGTDAFVLALLGCNVIACERNSVIYKLLADGFERATSAEWFNRLSFVIKNIDGFEHLTSLDETQLPDVIYIDPMFPEKTKSALVKKEMRILREIVGDDWDADRLFELALTKAKKRVVVKRAKLAPPINHQKPDIIFKGKSTRYDVYIPRTKDAILR